MDALPKLSLAILSALLQAGRPTHAAALRSAVEAKMAGPVNRGALARALAELRETGLLNARRGKPAPHGGPRRVLYALTDSGRATLLGEMRAFARLTRVRKLSPLAVSFLKNPPPGSKLARSAHYGVDVSRLSRVLVQSPQERYRQAVEAMNAFRKYAR